MAALVYCRPSKRPGVASARQTVAPGMMRAEPRPKPVDHRAPRRQKVREELVASVRKRYCWPPPPPVSVRAVPTRAATWAVTPEATREERRWNHCR